MDEPVDLGVAVHVFTLFLDREPTDPELDELHAAGCDDAAFGVEGGVARVVFDREAPSRDEAVASARAAVESVGLAVLRVEEGDVGR